jgi:hypothetical protein
MRTCSRCCNLLTCYARVLAHPQRGTGLWIHSFWPLSACRASRRRSRASWSILRSTTSSSTRKLGRSPTPTPPTSSPTPSSCSTRTSTTRRFVAAEASSLVPGLRARAHAAHTLARERGCVRCLRAVGAGPGAPWCCSAAVHARVRALFAASPLGTPLLRAASSHWRGCHEALDV